MATALALALERSIAQLFKDMNLEARGIQGLDELLTEGLESSWKWIFLTALFGRPERYLPIYTAEDGTRYRLIEAWIAEGEIVVEVEVALPGGNFGKPSEHTISGIRLMTGLDVGSPGRQ